MNDTPRTNDIIEQVKGFRTSFAIYSLEQFSRELERELTAVTEQRDRLADLVKQFIYIIDITEESDGGRLFHPTNITSCRAGDLQKIGELVEALRRASNDL
jgi:hypothetical protein